MRGLFITLEGIDGCGKSTQLNMLVRTLSELGIHITVTREPGGTPPGEQMRALLLASDSRLSPAAELLLMAADRAQDVAEVIRPALEAGRTVISDRYTDSTIAFQGYGRRLDLDMIDELNRFATGGLSPDRTILFDLPPGKARIRLDARLTAEPGPAMTRFDDELFDFHTRVRNCYLRLAATEPDRFRIIDATASVEVIHEKLVALVLPLITEIRGQ